MKKDYCDITVVLDRSGSMGSIRRDTIGGFNSFLEEQRKVPGKATISLVQFDNLYEPNYTAMPVSEAHLLTEQTYSPRGGTALLDAVGRTIDETGRRLRNMPESERPSKVIFLVITDGEENASRTYTKEQIQEMVRRQTEQFNWEFVYLGANVDAFSEASSMGFAMSNTSGYAATSKGIASAFATYSSNVAGLRSGTRSTMAFSDEDRKKNNEE